jgi:hypothetical protein
MSPPPPPNPLKNSPWPTTTCLWRYSSTVPCAGTTEQLYAVALGGTSLYVIDKDQGSAVVAASLTLTTTGQAVRVERLAARVRPSNAQCRALVVTNGDTLHKHLSGVYTPQHPVTRPPIVARSKWSVLAVGGARHAARGHTSDGRGVRQLLHSKVRGGGRLPPPSRP